MKQSIEFHGVPRSTERFQAGDAALAFTAVQYTYNNKSAIAVLITCEDNPIRFTLGNATPTQGTAGLGHILYVGQSLRLPNPAALRTFRYINHTNGANGVLQATFEYEIGA